MDRREVGRAVGRALADACWRLHSGGARGADTAFAAGAKGASRAIWRAVTDSYRQNGARYMDGAPAARDPPAAPAAGTARTATGYGPLTRHTTARRKRR